MALVRPRFFFPALELPPGCPIRFNANAYVAPGTVGGDAGLAFPAVPFVINNGVTTYSNVVHVAGLRSFQIAIQISAGGTLEIRPVLIMPTDAVTASVEEVFGTVVVGEGLKAFGWGAHAGNGGGVGLDGRLYTHIKLGLKATVANCTVSRMDGLWCASV